MNNTIILKKGYAKLTEKEYNEFKKGDTIWGANCEPEELKRWNIEQKEEAIKELEKYSSEYCGGNVWDITEYALEFCECDSEGEFVQGSDYELAESK